MSAYLHRAFDELAALIVSTWSIPAGKVVARSNKIERLPWRELIAEYEKNGTEGMQLPYVVIDHGAVVEEPSKGAHNDYYWVPVAIYYVDGTRLGRISTTVTMGVASATQTVGSTTGMFVGQKLYFAVANVYRFVSSIGGPTTVVLTESVTSTTGEAVTSEAVTDVEARTEQLRDVIKPGSTARTYFKLFEAPTIDSSPSNPANMTFFDANTPLIASALVFRMLVGESGIS